MMLLVSRRASPALLRWCCWVYAGCVLVLWLVLGTVAERWWPAALLVYGPRWVGLVPLLLLGPAACWYPRLLPPLGAALLVLVGPVMGLCLPWRAWVRPAGDGAPLRVLSCNADGSHSDADALGLYVARTLPDVVALQEWAPEHEKAVFWQQDWHIRTTEDGLCLASRFPIRKVEALHGGDLGLPGGLLRCDLETPQGTLHFINLHLPTPRAGLEAVLSRGGHGPEQVEANTEVRWHASETASRWVDRVGCPVVLAGDFNLTEDSAIYRRFWSGRANAFMAAGLGWGHTKFTRHFGVRIDHVLAGPGFSFRSCRVGPDVGSDHRPVLADLRWPGPPAGEGGQP
jgi:endonuclease/exonuclease/phosphatase family metal-dependent hydrolase